MGRIKTRPALTLLSLVLTDLAALTLAASASVFLRYVFGGQFEFATYARLTPMLLVFISAFFLVGLYQGTALNPVEELRLLTITVTLVYLFLGVASFLFQTSEVYSRIAFLVAWLLSLFALPLSRALTREWFARRSWWGFPVVILGANETSALAIETLRRQVGLGLIPVAVLDDHSSESAIHDVPILGKLEAMMEIAKRQNVKHALIAMPDASRAELLEVIENATNAFPKVFVLPNLIGVASLWAVARDFGGLLGLEVRQNLLNPSSRFVKRILDITVILVSLPLTLPIALLIASIIKMESRGAALYTHKRVGLSGNEFGALKFRSMLPNSDHILEKHLKTDSAARIEWDAAQKLQSDPRVTNFGRFLRRSSLDELPQLWNVLRGEMSLIGPRPIVRDEISRYEGAFGLYCRVLPGLGGMWQVSGRNDTTYAERVRLDTYYVRNWSVWLDVYLIARTVSSVMRQHGAY
jgi:Undecaprenyl-phosphate galactose phosphotransferase WbaP